MKKLNVTIFVASDSQHLKQVIVGFQLLNKKNKINLSYTETQLSGKEIELPHEHIVIAYIEEKIIVFDMMDGYRPLFKDRFDFDKMLKSVDAYFKRSFSSAINAELLSEDQIKKICPYGFNYYMWLENNNKKAERLSVRDIYISLRTKFNFQSNNNQPNYKYKIFEKKPIRKNVPAKIVFLTRLWDPELEKCFSTEELDHINNMRISIIRILKQKYGESFTGGIEDSAYARERCPDIIVSKEYTDKQNYLKIMQSASICIGSIGLHKSIGWKTGEYVAASKAIINEKFAYEVPGNFIENVNYIPFLSVKECIDAVEMLMNDQDKLLKMSRANHDYYRKYGRPDKLIGNAIDTFLKQYN